MVNKSETISSIYLICLVTLNALEFDYIFAEGSFLRSKNMYKYRAVNKLITTHFTFSKTKTNIRS